MHSILIQILKGALIGAANVVPGVSGGTMALLTGIFERLINAVSAFNPTALQLASKKEWRTLWKHIDGTFLLAIGIGVLLSLFSFAKLLDLLFIQHKLYVWAFFFGLIAASVYFVGKTVKQWNLSVRLFFILGTLIAGSMAFLTPATGSDSTFYLMSCGAIATCSMILPGISGAFVLLLMGNYELLINAISQFQLAQLIPFGIGALLGILLFARLLSWIFKHYHDQTISLLTGFILGSLAILWPWKTEIIQTLTKGAELKEKVVGYHYTMPPLQIETAIAIALILVGVLLISWIEIASRQPSKNTQTH